jgi:hypothetical protein
MRIPAPGDFASVQREHQKPHYQTDGTARIMHGKNKHNRHPKSAPRTFRDFIQPFHTSNLRGKLFFQFMESFPVSENIFSVIGGYL